MKSLFLHIAFLSSALLMFTSCIGGRNQEVSEKLSEWDSEVSNRNYFEGDTLYRTLLDGLDLINPKSLSKEEKAHYNLLHTILSDKSMRDFTSDSIIGTSVDYYQKKEDAYNLLRSLVYQGIVRYRIDEKDTSAFLIMKKAETLSSHLNENDTMIFRIKGLMYGTIGEMLFADGCYLTAEEYYRKATDSFNICSDINNFALIT